MEGRRTCREKVMRREEDPVRIRREDNEENRTCEDKLMRWREEDSVRIR